MLKRNSKSNKSSADEKTIDNEQVDKNFTNEHSTDKNPADESGKKASTSKTMGETKDATETEQNKLTSLIGDLQRTRADFENYRKQVDLQKSQIKALAEKSTILKLIPLIDDLARAISTYPDQLSSLEKSLEKSLKELGLEKMNTEKGIEFNPDLHEAVSMDDESDGEKEIIVETLRPGYLYNDEVLRPAMVRVSRA